MSDGPLLRKIAHFLLLPVLTLAAFFVLYSYRSIDDNRLTSWKWLFADTDLLVFIPLIIGGIAAASYLFRLSYLKQRPALFLFFLSFAVSSLFWKVPEVIIDTSRYFTQAKHLEIYGIQYFISEWGNAVNAWTDLPLVPFLYGMIFKMFGESRAYIQVFNSLLYSFTVITTYSIGKTLWDEDTGIFAGSLLLGIPYIFSQTPLMMVDVPTMFFLTLSTFTFIKGLGKGGAWTIFSSFAVFCALLSKYSTLMMMSVLFVVFIVYLIQGTGGHNREDRKRVVLRAVLIAAIAGLMIGIVLLIKYDVFISQIKFLNEYQRPGLRRWGESFESTFLYQVHPFITIAALYSVYAAIRRKDLKFIIIAWLLVLVVVFQIKRSRYVLLVFPMLTLMASYGLQMIKSPGLKKQFISCVAGSSIVIAIFAYMPFLQKMSLVNLEAAGDYLASVDSEKIEVFIIPSDDAFINQAVAVPILDLYTDRGIIYYHDKAAQPVEEIAESPLRFTWEYKNPEYYTGGYPSAGSRSAVAVISNGRYESLPEWIDEKIKGFRKARVFKTTTGIFKYNPNVTIYLHQ